ncbi:MAG: hypothetical protein ABSC73_07510 [Acidimicrobiales bacterium]|jgi:hypothetical protein
MGSSSQLCHPVATRSLCLNYTVGTGNSPYLAGKIALTAVVAWSGR